MNLNIQFFSILLYMYGKYILFREYFEMLITREIAAHFLPLDSQSFLQPVENDHRRLIPGKITSSIYPHPLQLPPTTDLIVDSPTRSK